jgi:hypothetical protein
LFFGSCGISSAPTLFVRCQDAGDAVLGADSTDHRGRQVRRRAARGRQGSGVHHLQTPFGNQLGGFQRTLGTLDLTTKPAGDRDGSETGLV